MDKLQNELHVPNERHSACLARLVQDGMALARLKTLLFMDSNQFPR